MNFVAECKECQRLAAEYEAATMEWFRAQGQLRVAQFSHEQESSDRLRDELSAISGRRDQLREATGKHELERHAEVAIPEAAAASGVR